MYQYANKCFIYNAMWNKYLITHKAKPEQRWPWWCCAGFSLPTEFIHSVCFALAGAAGLKIKLAKQINHMMRRLADCCCFFPPSSYWHFFLLPSFPPEFAAFSPRGSLWTGPDVPGSTLPHSLPHGIFMGNQALQLSTAPRHTDQRPLIYLFHHPAAWLPNAQQQFNIQKYLLTFLFLSETLATSLFFQCFFSWSFHWHSSPWHAFFLICWYFGGSFPALPFFYPTLVFSLFLYFCCTLSLSQPHFY